MKRSSTADVFTSVITSVAGAVILLSILAVIATVLVMGDAECCRGMDGW